MSKNLLDANVLIEKLAVELKKEEALSAPKWSEFAKSGRHNERPPVRTDWWLVRAAAVLRTISNLGPVGTQKLRVKYGGKKNRGHKPGKFYPGSGSVARKIMQQLEKAELVKQATKGTHKGRVITKKGAELINSASKDGTR